MRDITDIMIIAVCEIPLDIEKIKNCLTYQMMNLKNELSVTYLVPDDFMPKLDAKCKWLIKPLQNDEFIHINTADILKKYHSEKYLLFKAKLIISPITNHIIAIIPDDIDEYTSALEYVADMMKGNLFERLN